MKTHRGKIIFAALVIGVLAAAWAVAKPLPAEPQDVAAEATLSCTLSVRCDTVLNHMDRLASEKNGLIPVDGVIFPATAVSFYAGESVFDLLQREMKRGNIHLEFVYTPLYQAAYIEGLHNLYEFDAGALSGWMYKVNDWVPNYSCSSYLLKDGDVVEWAYTCDLGADLGAANAAEKQYEAQRSGVLSESRSGARQDRRREAA
jgi:hypothetical protein